jgi:hypothetical protein
MKTKTLAAFLLLTIATVANGFQTVIEWMKHTSVEGRYSVLMPQTPKLKAQETTAATGEKMTQYMAEAADSNSLYWVGYFDYTPNMTFSLDKARDGMLAAVKGTLLSEEIISLGGNPGREFKVFAKTETGMEFLIRARMYDIGRRIYALQHLVLKSSDSPVIAEKTTKFFDSFKVTAGK